MTSPSSPHPVPPVYTFHPDDYVEADAGTTHTLNFDVSSDPPLVEDVQHTLIMEGGEPAPRRFRVKGNSIIFRNVTLNDSGTYVISCENDDGEVGQASLDLEVTSPLSRTGETDI